MDFLTLIGKLCDARGVSGYEDEAIEVAREYCKGFATVKEDSMRNLYIFPDYNKGNRPLVMLDAHADEVGFIVQAIKPDGTLRFLPLGTWNERSLASSKVQIPTSSGYITGVISATPPHFLTEAQRNAPITYESLSIDIGATDAAQAKEWGIKIGAPVTPLSPFEYDENRGILHGKAFDDRLGVACMLETLKRLEGAKLEVDLVGVVSTQEEVGVRGIVAVLDNIKPSAAICFEGCPADDTFAAPYMVQDRLRGGVMLRHMDRSVICSPRFNAFAIDIAENENIKLQQAVRSGGGNNGAYIVSANGGTPVIVAGIPVRYIHTCNCIAAFEDLESNIEFGVKVCEKLNEKAIASF